MAAVAFDTLKVARRLKDAGYSDEQAEVQAEIIASTVIPQVNALLSN